MQVGNEGDLETQRCAAYALSNLATDYSLRAYIVKSGGLPPLISLACSEESQSDMKAAVSCLRGLAASPLTRGEMVALGIGGLHGWKVHGAFAIL